MARKIDPPSPLRTRLQNEILQQVRNARKEIDPDVLKRARDAILKAHSNEAASEPVDRSHTLKTISDYLKLIKNNKKQCDDIRDLLITKR